jgi:hypothetical protein
MPSGSVVISMVEASMESVRQPSANAASMSCRVTPCARPQAPCTPIAEAEHEVAAARREYGPQPGDVRGAVGRVEDMEEPAVEHGVELLAQVCQLAGVMAQEAGTETSFPCLALGGAQGSDGEVGAGGVETEAGGHERVFAGSATEVEDAATDSTRLGEDEKGGLGASDVPGRAVGVEIVGLSRRWPPGPWSGGPVMRTSFRGR